MGSKKRDRNKYHMRKIEEEIQKITDHILAIKENTGPEYPTIQTFLITGVEYLRGFKENFWKQLKKLV